MCIENSAASGYPDLNETKTNHHTPSSLTRLGPHASHAHVLTYEMLHSSSASTLSLSASYLPTSNLLLRHPLCLNLSIRSLISSLSPAVTSLENDALGLTYEPRRLENDARKSGDAHPLVGEDASGVERPEVGSGLASSERTAAMCVSTCARRSASTAA